jgi:hypothetical protein
MLGKGRELKSLLPYPGSVILRRVGRELGTMKKGRLAKRPLFIGAKGGIPFRTAEGFSNNDGKTCTSTKQAKHVGFSDGIEVLPTTLQILIPAILVKTLGNVRKEIPLYPRRV